MKIAPTNYSQALNCSTSFKGLDFKNLSNEDKKVFINNNLEELKNLGEKWDISFVSCESMDPKNKTIEIYARPLKKGLNFFQRFFRPAASVTQVTPNATLGTKYANEAFMSSVKEAVEAVRRQVIIHRIFPIL